MYAHKVIDDIGKYLKIPNIDKKYLLMNKAMVELAEKFHLPDFDRIDISKQHEDIERSDDLLHFSPPYDLCWFDYESITGKETKEHQMRSSKRGVIVLRNSDFLLFRVFYYLDEMRGWTPPGIEYILNLESKGYSHRSIDIAGTSFDKKALKTTSIEDMGDVCHVLQAMSILNCKNITTEDNLPPKKLNKKRKKNGKQEIFTYKTLIIKPTKKQKKSGLNDSQDLWDNRVHMCRGHFKEFTKEKPLFGRFTGRYWWEPQVRGDKTKGVVMKDYEVKI